MPHLLWSSVDVHVRFCSVLLFSVDILFLAIDYILTWALIAASVLKEKLAALGSSGVLADHQLQAQLQEHHLKGWGWDDAFLSLLPVIYELEIFNNVFIISISFFLFKNYCQDIWMFTWVSGSLLYGLEQIAPFDERYEQKALRELVFFELYETGRSTMDLWVFEHEVLERVNIWWQNRRSFE